MPDMWACPHFQAIAKTLVHDGFQAGVIRIGNAFYRQDPYHSDVIAKKRVVPGPRRCLALTN